MNRLFSTLISVLLAIVLLGLLVLVHELGHYTAARAVGIAVDEFSIGFGPKLLSVVRKGIRYSIRVLPLGGYVRFFGEDEENPDPRALNNQPVWKRFIAVLAGATMNFVAAYVIIAIFLTAYGDMFQVMKPAESTTEIAYVADNSAASRDGLRVGDVITAVNGAQVTTSEDVVKVVRTSEESVELTVKRGDGTETVRITPQWNESQKAYQMGISFLATPQPLNFGETIVGAGKWMVSTSGMMLKTVGSLFIGRGNLNEMSGPVGIISSISSVFQEEQGRMQQVLYLAAVISLNLGLVNLLPIPALDGSRLVILLIEGIRRKPMNRNAEAMVHFVGFVLLMGFILFISYRDVVGLFGGTR